MTSKLTPEASKRYGHFQWQMTLHTSADHVHTRVYQCKEIDAVKTVFTPVTNYVKGQDMDPSCKEFGEEQTIYRMKIQS